MGDFISVDDRDLRAFARHMRFKRPSQITAVVRTVLNDEAFSTGKMARGSTIPKYFNLRSKWIQSSVIVDKANGKDKKKMFSEVGSKKRWRRNPSNDFLGLGEQETGANIQDPDIKTSWSRGGTFQRRVRPTLRLNRLGQFVEINDSNREISTLRMLDRQNYRGAIRIKRSRRFRKGIYKFGTKKQTTNSGDKIRSIKMVQDLSRNVARLRKRPWLRTATDKAVNKQTVARFYRRAFERYVTPRPRRIR